MRSAGFANSNTFEVFIQNPFGSFGTFAALLSQRVSGKDLWFRGKGTNHVTAGNGQCGCDGMSVGRVGWYGFGQSSRRSSRWLCSSPLWECWRLRRRLWVWIRVRSESHPPACTRLYVPTGLCLSPGGGIWIWSPAWFRTCIWLCSTGVRTEYPWIWAVYSVMWLSIPAGRVFWLDLPTASLSELRPELPALRQIHQIAEPV